MNFQFSSKDQGNERTTPVADGGHKHSVIWLYPDLFHKYVENNLLNYDKMIGYRINIVAN